MKEKQISHYFLVMLCYCFLIYNYGWSQGSNDEKIISNLQTKIPKMMEQVDVPGLSIAIIKDSKVIWSAGFGITDYESKNLVTDNTIFEAGSLSKPVFAYAVLKLVEQGLLDLDKSLSSYLPVKYILDDSIDQVTARMVLNHTSGFPLWWPEGENLKIYFKPGEKFSYSSEGFVYLQEVVETITKKPLSEFMTEQVFGPLHMINSSYAWENRFEKHIAFGHNQFGQEETPWMRNRGNAASSLHTTTSDYAKFLIAILNSSGLQKATSEQMFRPQIKLNPNCIDCTDNQTGTLSESLAWGLGLGLYNSGKENLSWHWADNLRHTSFFVLSKYSKSGILYFTNSCNGLTLANEIIKPIFGGIRPILDWLHYSDYDSPEMIFRQTVLKEGTEKGLDLYFKLKQNNENHENFIGENALNEIGYILLNINRIPEAIDIFRLNVEEHPNSWNVYDSLAEAYATQGDTEHAVNYYNIALKKVTEENQRKRIVKTMEDLQTH